MRDMIFLSDRITYNAPLCCLEHVSEDVSVHLTPHEKKLLELILAQRGQKETIIEEIWGCHGVIVTSSSYHQLVKMLRSKFQKVGLSPDMLQTIPRYGVVLHVNLPSDEAETDTDTTSIKLTPPAYKDQIIRSFSCTLEQQNFNENKTVAKVNLRSFYPYVFIVILAIVLIFQLLNLTKNTDLFKYHKEYENVQYYATSSVLFNKAIMSQVMSKETKDYSHIYLSENGPKILVSYCNDDISKDSTLCLNNYFSSY